MSRMRDGKGRPLQPPFPKPTNLSSSVLPTRIDRSKVLPMAEAMARDLCLYPVDDRDNVCGCQRFDNGSRTRPTHYCEAHYAKMQGTPRVSTGAPWAFRRR